MAKKGRLGIEADLGEVVGKQNLAVAEGGLVHLDAFVSHGLHGNEADQSGHGAQWTFLAQGVIRGLLIPLQPTSIHERLEGFPNWLHVRAVWGLFTRRVDDVEVAEWIAGELVLQLVIAVCDIAPSGHQVGLVGWW